MKRKKKNQTFNILLPEQANVIFIKLIIWLIGVIAVTPMLLLIFLYFFLKVK